jgi:Glycosyl hydrolase family 26
VSPAPTTHETDRRRGRAAVRASLIAILLMLAIVPASASASSPGKTLGVYAGPGDPNAVSKFEAELGRPVAVVHDALARETWAAMTDVSWWTSQWSPSKYFGRVIYSVPMLPYSGGTLAQGASGNFNGYFRTLAERLVAGGQGSSILRIGPEMNGNWFRWSIKVANGGADYAEYWRQIVNTMRAVPGAHFKFDWCANAGSSYLNGKQMEAESAYPGNAYVDYIGTDVYDQSWVPNHADPAARWKDLMTTHNGLAWHRAFAASKGKPMTFPEWGVSNRFNDNNGGGDAPYFITQMYKWIKANNVAYNMYFEWADPNGDYRIFEGKTPKAAARFRELFGNDNGDAGSGSGGSTGTNAAKLSIKRVKISRSSRRLTLLATLAPHASGAARVTLSAGGRKTRFSKKVKGGRLKVSRKISRAMARKGTGTVTVSYGGNKTTRAQKVRLRIAPGKPKLRVTSGPALNGAQLTASGQINRRAHGAIRIELNFLVAGKSVTRAFKAKISGGRWSLATQVPAAVSAELAQRTGGATAYAIYGGSRRISGAMKLYDVLAAR